MDGVEEAVPEQQEPALRDVSRRRAAVRLQEEAANRAPVASPLPDSAQLLVKSHRFSAGRHLLRKTHRLQRKEAAPRLAREGIY